MEETPDPQDALEAADAILLLDRDGSRRGSLGDRLSREGYIVFTESDGRGALRLLERQAIDLVLAFVDVADLRSASLIGRIREHFADTPILVMLASDSAAKATALVEIGATECLTRPLHVPTLLDTLGRLIEERRPARAVPDAEHTNAPYLAGIIGRSLSMRRLYEGMARVASSSAPVLITGETGTGKELIARAVHQASGLGSFVPVNCGAIPAGLLESELFGHVRGAFTGADRDKPGLFEAASGGTIFLDEIAELPLPLQPKLLRVLQSGEMRRVGDTLTRHVNVRLIAASHANLAAAVAARSFREDLFYRINVLRLDVPPLRARITDIPLLADALLRAIATRERRPVKHFSPAALAELIAYAWPGNVRQLQNIVERVALFADTSTIDVDDLPDEIRGVAPSNTVVQRIGEDVTLAEIEREHILGVLTRAGGNRSRAAQVLGLPRRTLYRRLTEYGVLHDPVGR